MTVAHSLNRVANWHVNLDQPNLALPLHEEALAIFTACADTRGIAETLDLLGIANYLHGDLDACTMYCERAIPLFRELNDLRQLSSLLSTIAVNGGDPTTIAVPAFREAAYWIRCGEEGLAIARDIGWTAGEAFAHFALCVATSARGQLGRALREADAALACAERVDHRQWRIAARCALGVAWSELLDVDRAEAELAEGLAAARLSGSTFWVNTFVALLASLHVAVGQVDRAAALLDTASLAERPRASMGQRQCWFTRAEVALAREQPERALQIIDVLASFDQHRARVEAMPQILHLKGQALIQLDRSEEAEQAFLKARESAAYFGFRTLFWKIDAARGRLLLDLGRAADAMDALRDARDAIEALADSVDDASLREQYQQRALARLPAEARARFLASPSTRLSRRELEVLRLIVDGKSDREIAASLSISHRTVMRHVTGILTKLDANSRTAAATLAVRQNLV